MLPAGPLWSRLAGGIADAFGDANFRLYSVGAVVSWLSFFVQVVAVSWSAWSLTHSTRWLAAVALLDAVPMAALAPLGGVVADRFDRFRVLLGCYAVATLQAATLAVLAATGHLTITALAVLALAHGVIHAFSVPSQYGMLPRFVVPERLSSAIAVASAYSQLGLFLGPALAGWILLHGGPALAFASNVLGYGVYFLSAARLRTPAGYRPMQTPRQSLAADLRDGWRVVSRHRGMAGLMSVMVFGDALAGAVRQMLPALADRHLHAGVEGLSTLLGCVGVGATLSALWLARGGARRASSRAILWAFLGCLVSTAGLMLSPTLLPAAAAMGLRGFCYEICRTGTVSLLQTAVADHLRGRLMSLQFLLQQGASATGVALAGLSAVPFGLRGPILCGTGVAFLAWMCAFLSRRRIAVAFATPTANSIVA